MHDGELLPILLGGATSEMRNLKPHLSSQQGFSVPHVINEEEKRKVDLTCGP